METKQGKKLWASEVRKVRRGKSHIQKRWVRCGKKSCKRCPHGPYDYVVYRAGRTVKTDYLGKTRG